MKPVNGRVIIRAAILFVVLFSAAMCVVAVVHPDTPLPNYWNPLRPLVVADPVTPLTHWKLRRTIDDPALCIAALEQAGQIAPKVITQTRRPECVVRTPVSLTMLGAAEITVSETDCATGLRIAMWEHHGIQPAAREFLGSSVREIIDIGSHNCRAMRTTSGNSTRWSTHATAMAVDISGFHLNDGRKLRLIEDWDRPGPVAQFLRAVRDSSCIWFVTTLSPDYNALHADHFHLQATGWGTCR